MHDKKVLLNAMHLRGNFSGVHRYTEQLLQHFVPHGMQIDRLATDHQRNTIQLSFPRLQRIWYEHMQLHRDFKRGKYDLYHATNYILPCFWKAPSILTVHDTIALDYPELCKNETALYYGLLLKHSIKQADKVLAVSEQVKKDIIRHTQIPEDRIKVTPLGVDHIFQTPPKKEDLDRVRRQYKLPARYCFFVGNLEPKKNVSRLIEAFHMLLPQIAEDIQLVIAGQQGWKYQSIFRTIDKLKIQSRVRLPGYVPQKDLPALYRHAAVFAFPSLYEGFGLPAVEAMACGTPVLVSDRGSLPAVTGGFARQVNPMDINELSKGLFEQLNSPNQERLLNAQQWAQQFQWKKTAARTWEAYEQILAKTVHA